MQILIQEFLGADLRFRISSKLPGDTNSIHGLHIECKL